MREILLSSLLAGEEPEAMGDEVVSQLTQVERG